MPTFPAKINYAPGDILTSAQMVDVGNGLNDLLPDAKGSLTTVSAANTPAQLTVGANGSTLVADSSASTGLRWQGNFAAAKNAIINGDFRINQRNFTSNTANGAFNFDRWFADQSGGTVTITPQTFTPGTAPVAGYEGANFLRIAVSGQSGANYASVTQRIEDVRTFAGQTITVSFWAKANSGTPSVVPLVFQRFGTGGSAATQKTPTASAISTSWARYSWTVTLDSLSGKTIGTGSNVEVELMVSWGGGAIGAQNNTFDIWGVQVEAGNTATAFQTATGTLAGELQAAQRYYYRTTGTAAGSPFAIGHSYSTTQATIFVPYPVTMRTNPTALEQSGTAGDYMVYNSAGGNITLSVVPAQSGLGNTRNMASVLVTVATGLTGGQAVPLSCATANGFLGWSAEL